MNPFSQIGILVIQTLGGLCALLMLLRFLLQLARADYYNPVSQGIVKLTNPLLLPTRRIIAGLWGLDLASLALALVAETLTIILSALCVGIFPNPLFLLAWAGLGLASMAIYLYLGAMIVMIVLSWVAPGTRHPLAVITLQLVRPLCAPFQRVLPDLGGIDFSPILVFLALNIARILVESGAAATQLGGLRAFVPGLF
jgi:YggT family protein